MMNTKYISHKNGGYTMKETNGKVKPFGIKDKLGYMFGDFGNDFKYFYADYFVTV